MWMSAPFDRTGLVSCHENVMVVVLDLLGLRPSLLGLDTVPTVEDCRHWTSVISQGTRIVGWILSSVLMRIEPS
jgi:hypothetical protein